MNTSSSYRARRLPSFKHVEFCSESWWLQFPRQNCHQKRESSDSYKSLQMCANIHYHNFGFVRVEPLALGPGLLLRRPGRSGSCQSTSGPEVIHKLPLHLIFTRLREHELVIKAERNVCMIWCFFHPFSFIRTAGWTETDYISRGKSTRTLLICMHSWRISSFPAAIISGRVEALRRGTQGGFLRIIRNPLGQ